MTPRRPIPRPVKGRPVLDWAAEMAATLARLRIIPGSGVVTEETPAGTVVHAATGLQFAWFYTTSTITTATASATGTALSSASLGYGGGTARICTKTGSGTSATYKPSTTASDTTIVNGVVYTTTIATGSFVLCANIDGEWVVILTARCPGT